MRTAINIFQREISVASEALSEFADEVEVRVLGVPVTEPPELLVVALPTMALEVIRLSQAVTPTLVYPDGQ
jgi:hypothetical protein